MKKFTLFVGMIAAMATSSMAQNVNIPDANFKAALVGNDAIDNNPADDEISLAEASAYTGTIDVSSQGIADLTGIEVFTALTELNCNYNSLTSLNVSSNTALKILYCSNNQLSSLNTSDVAALTELHCAYNQLASFDISTNTALTGLGCSNNLLTSLDVSNNTALSKLHCQNNQLTSLDVSGLTSLYKIYCYENQLPTLDVSSNTALQYLDCSGNSLTSLNVSSNTALDSLYCRNNQLLSLNTSGVTALTELHCANNQLASLDISTNTALTALGCSNNLLTSLVVSGNTDLSKLHCQNNQLVILDVSANTALTSLYCYYNSLRGLNVKNDNNSILLDFNATNNPDLTCIQVDDPDWSAFNWGNIDGSESFSEVCTVNIPDANFKAALLEIAGLDGNIDGEIQYDEASAYTGQIDVSSKSISDLTGIESFPNITSLNCNNNSLSSLFVTNNTDLTTLTCNNNSLMTLDVSANRALTALYCNDNQLTSLNVKNTNNSNFTNFNATNNTDLTCILIDGGGVIYSESPWTNKDDGASFNEVCGWSTVNIPDANFKSALVDDPSINTSGDAEIQYDEASAYTGTIDVSYQDIIDLTGIEAFTNIISLDCSGNSLTSLNVSGLASLTEIRCYENQLPTLDVSSNTALQYLDCDYNSLASLDVSPNTELASLYCYNNQLTTLDVSSNLALQTLYCHTNSLAALNVSTNTFLIELDCSNNQLTSLDVSINTALASLYCNNNSLTSLDVSFNTALQYLYCHINSLTSLDVKNGNNTSLSDFYATGNPDLTCIQVDDAAYMNSSFPSSIDGIESFSTDCNADLLWTGDINTDWNTANNWNNFFVPSGSNNITIPDATATNNPVATNVIVGSGKFLTINPAGVLTVSETLTNNGTVIIQSDETNTGSLITTTATGTGTTTVQRYMAAASWRIATSPLAGQTIGGFLTDNSTIATNIATPTLRGMTDYNIATNAWNSYFTNSEAASISVGKGYMLRAKSDGAGVVSFNGTLNAAATTVTLDNASGTKWNCVGNPFTSAITNSAIFTANAGVFESSYVALYVYNGASYDIVNLASEETTKTQAGQGFFVKAATTSLLFPIEAKVHDNAAVLRSSSAKPEIKLIAVNGGKRASTSIKFIAGTSTGLDEGYDAGVFKGDLGLNLYTRLVDDNGIDFGLQCLPDNDFSHLIIPLGIESKVGGEVVFSVERIDLPEECMVILEDKAGNTFTDLSKNAYTTTVAANSSISDRFRIHTSYLSTGLNSENFAGQLSAYAVRNTEIRLNGEVSKQAIATLYDVQGKVVLIKNLKEGSLNSIETPNIRTGIYMLSVKDNERVQVFKIPVRE